MGRHSSGTGGMFGGKEPRRSSRRQDNDARPMGSVVRAGRSRRLDIDAADSARTPSVEQAPPRLRAEIDRRRGKGKKVALATAGGILGVLLIAGIAFGVWVSSLESKMVVKKEQLSANLTAAKPQEPYTILLLGADRRGKKGGRSDTIILAKVDPVNKQMWMLSIPRDTRVELPGYGAVKINAAYSYGGPDGAIKAVKKLTGVPINHYMEVDFKGFTKAVDALGGVWLDVPYEINDRQAASHSHGKARHIDKGYQLLDGEHALTFVRARHQFADQDFSRMRNQQLFFKAIADQVSKIDNIGKVPHVVSVVAPYIRTDLTLMDMIRTAQALRSAGSKRLYTATVPGVWRSPFIWADEKKKETLVKRMLEGVSFEGSKTVEPTSTAAPATTKKPAEITVTVRNGTTVAGLAAQASSILKARSFKVVDTGNTQSPSYTSMMIYYKTDKAAAQLVADAMPPGAKIVQSNGMVTKFDSEVLVVVGKDWDLSKVPAADVQTN